MPSFLITSLCGDTSAGAAFSQMLLQRSDDGQLSHQNGQLLFWQKFSADYFDVRSIVFGELMF